MKNNKKQGILRFFIYYDNKEKEFVGVCVDLGIIKCGGNPYYLKKDLINASIGYLEAVAKENLSDNLLNQKLSKEYRDIFVKINDAVKTRKVAMRTDLNLDEAETFVRRVPAELCPAI